MRISFSLDRDLFIKKGERFCIGNNISFGLKIIPLLHPLFLKVGSFLFYKNDLIGQIEESLWSFVENSKKEKVYIVKAKKDVLLEAGDSLFFELKFEGYSLGVITLSDKGAMGKREDESGPLIFSMIKKTLPITYETYFIIPDEKDLLHYLLIKLILEDQIDIVITTGGTGVTSRDITSDVTEKVIEKRLLAFEWAMTSEGLKKTPHAIISRAVCGILNKSLIINLPGSPKAVKENLSVILPALSHFMEKLKDSPKDCASL